MSLLPYDCERCGKLLRTYSGEHLCEECAAQLGRDTHAPFWGAFPSHPDAQLTAMVERELRFTIELQSKAKAA